MSWRSEMVPSTFIKWLNRLSLCPLPSVLSAQDWVTCAGKICISSSLKCPRYWTLVHLSTVVETQFYSFLLSATPLTSSLVQLFCVWRKAWTCPTSKDKVKRNQSHFGIKLEEMRWKWCGSGACCHGNLVVPTEPQRFWLESVGHHIVYSWVLPWVEGSY